MVKRCFLLIIFVTVALIGPPGMTGAQGVPDRIAISGPDWEGEIEVTDAALLCFGTPSSLHLCGAYFILGVVAEGAVAFP